MEADGLQPIPIFINGVEAHTVVRDLLTSPYEQQRRAQGAVDTPTLSPQCVEVRHEGVRVTARRVQVVESSLSSLSLFPGGDLGTPERRGASSCFHSCCPRGRRSMPSSTPSGSRSLVGRRDRWKPGGVSMLRLTCSRPRTCRISWRHRCSSRTWWGGGETASRGCSRCKQLTMTRRSHPADRTWSMVPSLPCLALEFEAL